MQNIQKQIHFVCKNLSKRLKVSEISCFRTNDVFFVDLSCTFVIQERLEPLSNRRFHRHLQFLRKFPLMTAESSKKQNFLNFDVLDDFTQTYVKN